MQYAYTAFNESGEIQQGTVDASTAQEAERWVLDHFLGLIAIKTAKKLTWSTLRSQFTLSVTQKITPVVIAFFFEQTAAALRVGVSITRALTLQADTIKKHRFRAIVQDVADHVQQGQRASEALALYPKIFPGIVTRILRGAEEVGRLEMGFQEASDYVMAGYLLKKKIMGAMYYPVSAMLLLVGAAFFMVYKVFPVLTNMYTAFDVKLPGLTVAMIQFTHAATRAGPYVVPALVGLIGGFVAMLRTKPGRLWKDYWLLRIPVFRTIMQETAVNRFLRTLRISLMAALSLDDSLQMAAESTNNLYIQREVDLVRPQIVAGKGLSDPLTDTKIFPALTMQGIRIGEETGTLDSALEHLIAYYDRDLDHRVNGLAEAINPILTGIAAVGVGLLLAATMLPMVYIVGHVQTP